ncbi:hypothetical protein I3842_01G143300 [Carya illinoinensis]|uniref:PPM-type phosphatase domain-containing protein n=1 Tax=Carya illinoinensis TaxID=32201 RepID=A0A922FYW9_CARIL|nr:hypothetical protein I3842_01G143300 [Carya illinoinensis]
MVLFPSFLDGLTRSESLKKGKNYENDVGRETAKTLAKEARKNELILSSSGTVKSNKSNNFASVCSKRGKKGINQDRLIVWEGENIVIANVGDSRAVLATSDDAGHLVPLQLSIDLKPNLPQEAERIAESKGRVFCLQDEPGVYRIWKPNGQTTGLALSRALGDYCLKDHGLISVPDVTQRNLTSRDKFVILATDGIWDVISNQEAVQIVSSTPDREKSAKRLVECAVRGWKHKKRGIAMDDISAICLFFHTPSPQPIPAVHVSK